MRPSPSSRLIYNQTNAVQSPRSRLSILQLHQHNGSTTDPTQPIRLRHQATQQTQSVPMPRVQRLFYSDQFGEWRTASPIATASQAIQPSATVQRQEPLTAEEAQFKQAFLEQAKKSSLPMTELSDQQIRQIRTNQSLQHLSPEASMSNAPDSQQVQIEGEPLRSLFRLGRIRLFTNEDPDKSARYQAYVNAHDGKKHLSQEKFNEICTFFERFTLPERQTIEATALLKPSETLYQSYAAQQITLPQDAECCLTEVVKRAFIGVDHTKLLSELTLVQKHQLQACYPAFAHFRHMLLCESSGFEIKQAIDSLRKVKQSIGPNALSFWFARWLTDLCGFDRSGDGLSDGLYQRCKIIFDLINRGVDGKISPCQVMPLYLQQFQQDLNLESSQFNAFNQPLKATAIQLFAYLDHISDAQQQGIMSGIAELPETIKSQLAEVFQQYQANAQVQSMTYMPAVLKTAMSQFSALGYDEQTSAKYAAKYTCQLLNQAYQAALARPDQIISARNAAFYQNWNSHQYAQAFIDEKIEFNVNAQGHIETKIKA